MQRAHSINIHSGPTVHQALIRHKDTTVSNSRGAFLLESIVQQGRQTTKHVIIIRNDNTLAQSKRQVPMRHIGGLGEIQDGFLEGTPLS